MTRLDKFENPFIIPAPDFSILHRTDTLVLVECPQMHRPYEVIGYLRKELGGNWGIAKWTSIIEGEETTLPNPHMNNRGYWAWLLVKQ